MAPHSGEVVGTATSAKTASSCDGQSITDSPPAPSKTRALFTALTEFDPQVWGMVSSHGGLTGNFESAIRGNSMSPAIPQGARVQVHQLSDPNYKLGDVVFFRTDTGFMIHRVVHMPKHARRAGYLLTLGDKCLVPDPPVDRGRILGTVLNINTVTGWRAPGPPVIPTGTHRLIRATNVAIMVMAIHCSVAGAGHLAGLLLAIQNWCQSPMARLFAAMRKHTLLRTAPYLATRSIGHLVDWVFHRNVHYATVDSSEFNTRFPPSHRNMIAGFITAVHQARPCGAGRAHVEQNLTRLNPRYRDLPRNIPALPDLNPPNVAALDFLARYVSSSDKDVLVDFPCGLGVLLAYAKDMGFANLYGYDNWSELPRASAADFLERAGLPDSILLSADDLAEVPVTVLTCMGFSLSLLAAQSSLLAKPTLKYILADQRGTPVSLPGFRRIQEYPGLITVYVRVETSVAEDKYGP